MKPWLLLSPQIAHHLSPYGLKVYSYIKGSTSTPTWNPFSFQNLSFKNRLGLAGGVDKNAEHISQWHRCGCGFIEVGTVTPQPQSANPGITIGRDQNTKSLWNKMGFPSDGADEVFFNLKNYMTNPHSGVDRVPIFVNIGKNRTTENTNAHKDYIYLIDKFSGLADAFVINISSPNTQGLRQLATPEYLESFLQPIIQHHHQIAKESRLPACPLFLKISPDLDNSDLESLIKNSCRIGIDGFVLTNTTLDRSQTPFYPQDGGVSGAPLKNKSLQALSIARKVIDQENVKKCLISVGGVMTADDVFERIERGADLVQVYSTLIFEGPGFFRKVAHFGKFRSQVSNSEHTHAKA